LAKIPLIRLNDAGRRWNSRVALRDFSLTIEPGSHVAIIGPSGSGKTTLLRLIMGALRASSGTVEVDGVSVASMTPAQIRQHRAGCGLVDQGALLLPQLSVHGNVIAGRLPSWPWWRTLLSLLVSFETERVATLLGEVGLADRQWDRAHELSGGQQQRVVIARALANEPSIVLADEPTAALDPATSRDVIELLARTTKKHRATLIVSTHRVSEVVNHVDRIIGLRQGKRVLDARPDDLEDGALDELYEGTNERA
jgi:phosphonate transport system ATP-binding protein